MIWSECEDEKKNQEVMHHADMVYKQACERTVCVNTLDQQNMIWDALNLEKKEK